MSQSPTEEVGPQQALGYINALNQLAARIEQGHSHSGRERNRCFLNTGSTKFADASAVSGLDFDDDGRAVVAVDWDHDGDLDVWLANRTGPQLRMMRNNSTAGQHYIALRLQGKKANRDGIGARVEVHLQGQHQQRLIQTLYAGSGFLSQGSKWLHFGLGAKATIEHISVRWPGGEVENFANAQRGKRYLLVEGSGDALEVENQRAVSLKPSPLKKPRSSQQATTWLAVRPPAPTISYIDPEDRQVTCDQNDGPILVNLWASWCAPCLGELQELSKQRLHLKKRGVTVVALNVDQLGDTDGRSPTENNQLLQNLQLQGGAATNETVDKMEILYWKTFGRRISLPLPTSFLIDAQGRLAAVYLGTLDVEKFLSDIKHLNDEPKKLRAWSLPISGRWHAPVGPFDLVGLGNAYLDASYPREAANALRSVVEQTATDANTLNTAGAALLEIGEDVQAEKYLRRALTIDPSSARARFNLALLQVKRGQLDSALAQLKQAIDSSPQFADAHFNLAHIYGKRQEWALAEAEYRQVLQIDPHYHRARNGLGRMLAQQNLLDEAESVFREVLKRLPLASSHYNLGQLLLTKGQIEEGVEQLRAAFPDQQAQAEALNRIGLEMTANGELDRAIAFYQVAIGHLNQNAELCFNLGNAYHQQGNHAASAKHFRNACRLAPEDSQLANALAWVLATSSDDTVRLPLKAVEWAEKAQRLASSQRAELLDTLAAAQASTGRYQLATKTAQLAHSVAVQSDQPGLATRIESRLKLYSKGQPFLEAAAP